MSQLAYDQFGQPFMYDGAQWAQTGDQGWIPPTGRVDAVPSKNFEDALNESLPAGYEGPFAVCSLSNAECSIFSQLPGMDLLDGPPPLPFNEFSYNPYAMGMGLLPPLPNLGFDLSAGTVNPALLGGSTFDLSSGSTTPFLSDASGFTTPFLSDASGSTTPSSSGLLSRIPSPLPAPTKTLTKKRKQPSTRPRVQAPRHNKVRVAIEAAAAVHAATGPSALRVCTFPGCGFISDTRTLHRRHMLSHTPNSFACEWCPALLSRRDAVLRHMRETCPSRHLH